MMKRLIALILHFSFSANNPALAAPPEASWKAMQSNLQKNAGLIAHRIHTKFTLPGDDGTMSGQYSTLIRDGTHQKPPLREFETETKDSRLGKKFSALDLSIATAFADNPERMFRSATGFAWAGEEEHEGYRWSILQLRSATEKSRAPIFARVWLNQTSGKIWKVHAVIEKPGLPGVKSVDVSVRYATAANDLNLPLTVSVAYPISIFFRTGNVSFTHDLSNWQTY